MEQLALDIVKEGLMLTIKTSLPILITGLVVGLVISIFQTATSIQEQTLSFVPKIIAVFLSIMLFGPWIMNLFVTFFKAMLERMTTFIG